jgi:hypothetical protein
MSTADIDLIYKYVLSELQNLLQVKTNFVLFNISNCEDRTVISL